MKKYFSLSLILTLMLGNATAFAKTEYIYRNRMNWVKLEDLSKKQLAGVVLQHPSTGLTQPQMAAMLMSLQINKGQLFKEELNTTQVFEDDEAQKLSGFLLTALSQAAPHQVVSVEVVHKKTKVILRNDYVSLFKVFVTDEGLHFYFSKLYAKLTGDYTQPANYDAAVQRAKSVRVSLSAGEGQKLAYSDENEIILDPSYDFAAGTALPPVEATAKAVAKAPATAKTAPPTPTAPAETPVTVDERLKKLDELKEQGLISPKEYKEKRKEILNDL